MKKKKKIFIPVFISPWVKYIDHITLNELLNSMFGDVIYNNFREILINSCKGLSLTRELVDKFMELKKESPTLNDLISFLDERGLFENKTAEETTQIIGEILKNYEISAIEFLMSINLSEFLKSLYHDIRPRILKSLKRAAPVIRERKFHIILKSIYERVIDLLSVGDERGLELLAIFPPLLGLLPEHLQMRIRSYMNIKKINPLQDAEFFSRALEDTIHEMVRQLNIETEYSTIMNELERAVHDVKVPGVKDDELLAISFAFGPAHGTRTFQTISRLVSMMELDLPMIEWLLVYLASRNHDPGLTPSDMNQLQNCFAKYRLTYATQYRLEIAKNFKSLIADKASTSGPISPTLANALWTIAFPGWKEALVAGEKTGYYVSVSEVKIERAMVVLGKLGDVARIGLVSAILRLADLLDVSHARNPSLPLIKRMIFLADYNSTFKQFLNAVLRREIVREIRVIGGKEEKLRLIHIHFKVNPNIKIVTPKGKIFNGKNALWELLVKELRKELGPELNTWTCRKFFTEELTESPYMSEWNKSLAYESPDKMVLEEQGIQITWDLEIEDGPEREIRLTEEEIKSFTNSGSKLILEELKAPLGRLAGIPAALEKYMLSSRLPLINTTTFSVADFLSRISGEESSRVYLRAENAIVLDNISRGKNVIIKGKPGSGASTLAMIAAFVLDSHGWRVFLATPMDTSFFRELLLWSREEKPSNVVVVVEHAELMWDRSLRLPYSIPAILVVSDDDTLVRREGDVVTELSVTTPFIENLARERVITEKPDEVLKRISGPNGPDLLRLDILTRHGKMKKKVKSELEDYLKSVSEVIAERMNSTGRKVKASEIKRDIMEVLKVVSSFSMYEFPVELAFVLRLLPSELDELVTQLWEHGILQIWEMEGIKVVRINPPGLGRIIMEEFYMDDEKKIAEHRRRLLLYLQEGINNGILALKLLLSMPDAGDWLGEGVMNARFDPATPRNLASLLLAQAIVDEIVAVESLKRRKDITRVLTAEKITFFMELLLALSRKTSGLVATEMLKKYRKVFLDMAVTLSPVELMKLFSVAKDAIGLLGGQIFRIVNPTLRQKIPALSARELAKFISLVATLVPEENESMLAQYIDLIMERLKEYRWEEKGYVIGALIKTGIKRYIKTLSIEIIKEEKEATISDILDAIYAAAHEDESSAIVLAEMFEDIFKTIAPKKVEIILDYIARNQEYPRVNDRLLALVEQPLLLYLSTADNKLLSRGLATIYGTSSFQEVVRKLGEIIKSRFSSLGEIGEFLGEVDGRAHGSAQVMLDLLSDEIMRYVSSSSPSDLGKFLFWMGKYHMRGRMRYIESTGILSKIEEMLTTATAEETRDFVYWTISGARDLGVRIIRKLISAMAGTMSSLDLRQAGNLFYIIGSVDYNLAMEFFEKTKEEIRTKMEETSLDDIAHFIYRVGYGNRRIANIFVWEYMDILGEKIQNSPPRVLFELIYWIAQVSEKAAMDIISKYDAVIVKNMEAHPRETMEGILRVSTSNLKIATELLNICSKRLIEDAADVRKLAERLLGVYESNITLARRMLELLETEIPRMEITNENAEAAITIFNIAAELNKLIAESLLKKIKPILDSFPENLSLILLGEFIASASKINGFWTEKFLTRHISQIKRILESVDCSTLMSFLESLSDGEPAIIRGFVLQIIDVLTRAASKLELSELFDMISRVGKISGKAATRLLKDPAVGLNEKIRKYNIDVLAKAFVKLRGYHNAIRQLSREILKEKLSTAPMDGVRDFVYMVVAYGGNEGKQLVRELLPVIKERLSSANEKERDSLLKHLEWVAKDIVELLNE